MENGNGNIKKGYIAAEKGDENAKGMLCGNSIPLR
jgi:hypothetical protein